MPRPPPTLLTPRQTGRIEAHLRSTRDDALAELLWKLRRRREVAAPPATALRQARELELVEPAPTAPLRLTPLGSRVADSLSEYAYWKQRGKRHHWSEEVGALAPARLCGQRILEVGCGAGVNLLSLQGCAAVIGIDVEPLYLQLTPILARVEGLPTPPRVCGRAERLPFADESFDVVLFHGSLPYMRIQEVLHETARVLRPGGRAIAIHSDQRQTLRLRLGRHGWSLLAPGVLLREARALAGMLLYPWLGRLLLQPSAPVHATGRQLQRWLERAGLSVNRRDTCRVAHEVCTVAEKPPARVHGP